MMQSRPSEQPSHSPTDIGRGSTAGLAWQTIEAQSGAPGFSAGDVSAVRVETPLQAAQQAPVVSASATIIESEVAQDLQLAYAVSRLRKDAEYFSSMEKIDKKLDSSSRRFTKYRTRFDNKVAEVHFENKSQAMFVADFLKVDRQLQQNAEQWNRALRRMVVFPSKTVLKESFKSLSAVKKEFLSEQRNTASAFRTLNRVALRRLPDKVPATTSAIQHYHDARNKFALKHHELEAEKCRLFEDNVRSLAALQLSQMRESLASIRAIQAKAPPNVRSIPPPSIAVTPSQQQSSFSSLPPSDQRIKRTIPLTTSSSATTTLPSAAAQPGKHEALQHHASMQDSSSSIKSQLEKIPSDAWIPIRGGMIAQLPSSAGN